MTEPTPRVAIADSPLSVILFAHALSTGTETSLTAWRHYLDSLHRPYEIFLLQETRPEVAAAPIEPVDDPVRSLRPILYERAAGYREAVNEAIRAARHPLIAFCTCDDQFEPPELDHLFKVIDQVDMVVGYRVGKSIPFWRLLLDTVLILLSKIVLGIPLAPTACWLGSEGWGRRWVARWIFGLRVNDPECPFRMARREIFERMPLQSHGPFLQVEMLAKANHLTCLIAEEPVTWTPPPVPVTDAISFGEDAWRVFRNPLFTPPLASNPA